MNGKLVTTVVGRDVERKILAGMTYDARFVQPNGHDAKVAEH